MARLVCTYVTAAIWTYEGIGNMEESQSVAYVKLDVSVVYSHH